jgi:hypothetical protein
MSTPRPFARLRSWSYPAAVALLGITTLSARAAPTFESITLGAASELVAFNMGSTTFSASNSGTLFDGNIGLGPGASTNFSGGGTVTGTLFKDPTASVQSNIGSQFNVVGGISTTSMTQAFADVTTASQQAALLDPTQTFAGNLSNGFTFASTGQFNVIDINGNVSVSNASKNVTLFGSADDFFIVNVLGSLTVSNGSFGLAGGLTADHVLVNVLGGDISLSNASSSLYGNFLDVAHSINLTPGTVYGAVMGNEIHTASGPMVFGDTYAAPIAAIPEPQTYALMLGGLGFVAFVARRRRAN